MMVEVIMHRLTEWHMEMCALRWCMQKKCADVIWMREVMQVGFRSMIAKHSGVISAKAGTQLAAHTSR